MSPPRLVRLSAFSLLLACGKSPREREAEALESLGSWAATGAMLAEQWAAASLPDPYVRSTTELARQEIGVLRGAPGSRSTGPDAPRQAGERLEAMYASFGRAVRAHDRDAARRLAARMRDLGGTLHATAESLAE